MKHLFKTAVLTAMIAVCAVSLPATAQTSRQNTKKQMAKAVINGSKGNVATVTTSNKPKTKSASEAKGKSPSKAKETPKAKTTTKAKETAKAGTATTTTSAKSNAKEKTQTESTKPKAKETAKAPAATTQAKPNKLVITDKGIEPVVFGANPVSLPASCKGVYAKKEKQEIWDCGDFMGYYWQFYDEKGKEIFSAEVDEKNKICSITVTTPNIPMENGMHVGMTQKQVEAFKGVKKIVPDEWADFPRLSYEIGKYTLWMDWEDGKTVQEILLIN